METLSGLVRRGRDEAVFMEAADGARLTYGEARARAGQLANAFRELGVGRGDRVGMQIEKSPTAVLLYLACLRAGAVLVPMNPAYTDAEVEYLVGDAEPALFVRDAAEIDAVADEQPRDYDDVPVGPDDLAALVYTSGTTGRPKGAMLSQGNLAANALTLHRIWGFRPDDVLLHALPIFHVHGLFVALNTVLANGSGLVFLPRFDPQLVLDHIGRCTVFMGVPTFYTRLLAEPGFDAEACRNMRLFVSGSAPLLATTHRAFNERTGHAILERYGMTETGMLTSNPLDGDRRAGTVGPPLPDVEVRVAETGGGEHGDLEHGDIEVRGPNVFQGYWKRPDLAATEFTADGFFRTGDVGSFDADGYLTLAARAKDVIITGGLNVYPKEVEDVLDQADGVAESAVVGVPDADFGEAVVAVVVPTSGSARDEAAIRSEARTRLAAYKVPKRVHFVDALPRNSMGKVEKARLRQSLAPTPTPPE